MVLHKTSFRYLHTWRMNCLFITIRAVKHQHQHLVNVSGCLVERLSLIAGHIWDRGGFETKRLQHSIRTFKLNECFNSF